jgi:hypothetical protein
MKARKRTKHLNWRSSSQRATILVCFVFLLSHMLTHDGRAGAVILLEYQKQTKVFLEMDVCSVVSIMLTQETTPMTLPWLAYAAFHLGSDSRVVQ